MPMFYRRDTAGRYGAIMGHFDYIPLLPTFTLVTATACDWLFNINCPVLG